MNRNGLVLLGSEVGDEIGSFLFGLETCEDHLGFWDVLLWVKQVFEQSLIAPLDGGGLVGSRVGVARNGTRLSSPDTIQVGSLLVASTLKKNISRYAFDPFQHKSNTIFLHLFTPLQFVIALYLLRDRPA